MGAGHPVLRLPAGGAADYNATESLNSKLRSAVGARGHFPNDDAATKLLYLVLRGVSRDWKMPQRERTAAKTQVAILFGERFSP